MSDTTDNNIIPLKNGGGEDLGFENVGPGMSHDPFSLDEVEIKDNEATGGIKVRSPEKVRLGQPNPKQMIRTNPEPGNCIKARVVRINNREHYLITTAAQALFAGEMDVCLLYYYVQYDGTPGIWPVVIEMKDEISTNPWHESNAEIAELAKSRWLRVVASEGCYIPRYAEGDLKEPKWPENQNYRDIVSTAFGRNIVRDKSHKLYKLLKGVP